MKLIHYVGQPSVASELTELGIKCSYKSNSKRDILKIEKDGEYHEVPSCSVIMINGNNIDILPDSILYKK